MRCERAWPRFRPRRSGRRERAQRAERRTCCPIAGAEINRRGALVKVQRSKGPKVQGSKGPRVRESAVWAVLYSLWATTYALAHDPNNDSNNRKRHVMCKIS